VPLFYIMVKKPKPNKWPKVVKGNHLTVTTYEDGSVEMVWDFEALETEINTAISVYLAKQKSGHLEKYGAKTKKD